MNPPMPPSMKLQLARTRRSVTLAAINNAHEVGASPQRVEQLERELVRMDAQVADLEAVEADDESLPYRADTDG